jgi:hypothetical protein
MPRQSKPYFREQTKSWYCSINGKQIVESAGKRLKVGQVRKRHLTKWFEDKNWSSTTKNDAMGVVKRAFNWAH